MNDCLKLNYFFYSAVTFSGVCKPTEDFESLDRAVTLNDDQSDLPKVSTTSVKPLLKQLLVSVVSKEVTLPDNEAELSAYTIPDEETNGPYSYVWSLLSQPEDQSGTMTDQNRVKVKLSHLSEGLYMFKVAVKGPSAEGEAYANVSVLPRKY